MCEILNNKFDLELSIPEDFISNYMDAYEAKIARIAKNIYSNQQISQSQVNKLLNQLENSSQEIEDEAKQMVKELKTSSIKLLKQAQEFRNNPNLKIAKKRDFIQAIENFFKKLWATIKLIAGSSVVAAHKLLKGILFIAKSLLKGVFLIKTVSEFLRKPLYGVISAINFLIEKVENFLQITHAIGSDITEDGETFSDYIQKHLKKVYSMIEKNYKIITQHA